LLVVGFRRPTVLNLTLSGLPADIAAR